VIPLLSGRPGSWPHAGAFYGCLDDGDPEGPWVAWSGRVGPAVSGAEMLERSWRASRAIHRSLLRGGLPERERRGAVVGLWSRLDAGLVLPGIGPIGALDAHEFHLLVVAGDRDGVALTATGLARVVALGYGEVWADGDHPLASARGLPRRPGVLTVDWADLRPLPPAWLVAVCPGDPSPDDPRALALAAGAPR